MKIFILLLRGIVKLIFGLYFGYGLIFNIKIIDKLGLIVLGIFLLLYGVIEFIISLMEVKLISLRSRNKMLTELANLLNKEDDGERI